MKRAIKYNSLTMTCAAAAAMAILVSACSHANAMVTISDTEFNNSDWTEQVSFLDHPDDWTFSVQQYASGGNPGAFRGQTWEYKDTDGNVTTLYTTDLYSAQTYNPTTQGAVTGVSFQIDDYTADAMGGSVAKNIGFAPAIEQAGNLYDAGWFVSSGTTWATRVWSNQTASDFYLYSGSGPTHPDFSASGAPLTFGYFDSENIGPAYSPYPLFHAVDNFAVTVVPEPASMLLLVAVPLFMRRRRLI